MPDDRDSDLARRFEELRRADDLAAPAFRSVRGPSEVARTRPASPRALRGWVLFAAVACLGALTLLVWFPGNRRAPSAHVAIANQAMSIASVSSMTAWHSPTDFLLRTPGSELLDRVPDGPWPVPEWGLENDFEQGRSPSPAPRTTSSSTSTPLKKGAAS